MNHLEVDLRAEVLASPAYQERIDGLYSLYVLSREERANPTRLLMIQDALGQLLKSYQEKKREFERQDNKLGAAVAKRLIKVAQDIADGIVWRSLRYDRLLIQQLAAKSKTGYLDDTFIDNLDEAGRIVLEKEQIVIINDLTRILRYGDLTIIDGQSIGIFENKSGQASARNVRAKRQKRNVKKLTEFWSTGVRVDDEGNRITLTRLNTPIKSYLSEIGRVIDDAQQNGYSQLQISECLAVEAFSVEKYSENRRQAPFSDIEYVLEFDNLMLFYQTATRHPPYTVFPFDDQTCFGLATGNIHLVTFLNMSALQSRFAQVGLILDFPTSIEAIRAYVKAPIAEQREQMEQFRLIVKSPPDFLLFDWDLLGLIHIDFFDEDTFIGVVRQIMQEAKPREGERLLTCIGLNGEVNLWN